MAFIMAIWTVGMLARLSTLSTLKHIGFYFCGMHFYINRTYLIQPFISVSSYLGTNYHKLSDYILDIPIFNLLHSNRLAFTFMAKMNAMMDLHRLLGEIIPEQTYSVSEAARYLGVHRCTIYAYIGHPEKPLPFTQLPDKSKLLFQGIDLIAYKASGLPKRGRKRKNDIP